MTAKGTLGSESVWGKSKDTEVLRASPAACSGSIPGREQRMRNNRQKKMGYNAAKQLLHNLGMTDDIKVEENELEIWHNF